MMQSISAFYSAIKPWLPQTNRIYLQASVTPWGPTTYGLNLTNSRGGLKIGKDWVLSSNFLTQDGEIEIGKLTEIWMYNVQVNLKLNRFHTTSRHEGWRKESSQDSHTLPLVRCLHFQLPVWLLQRQSLVSPHTSSEGTPCMHTPSIVRPSAAKWYLVSCLDVWGRMHHVDYLFDYDWWCNDAWVRIWLHQWLCRSVRTLLSHSENDMDNLRTSLAVRMEPVFSSWNVQVIIDSHSFES